MFHLNVIQEGQCGALLPSLPVAAAPCRGSLEEIDLPGHYPPTGCVMLVGG